MIDIKFSKRINWLYDKNNKNIIKETKVWRIKIFKYSFIIWKLETGLVANFIGNLLVDKSTGHYMHKPLGTIVMFSEDFTPKLFKIDDKSLIKR